MGFHFIVSLFGVILFVCLFVLIFFKKSWALFALASIHHPCPYFSMVGGP